MEQKNTNYYFLYTFCFFGLFSGVVLGTLLATTTFTGNEILRSLYPFFFFGGGGVYLFVYIVFSESDFFKKYEDIARTFRSFLFFHFTICNGLFVVGIARDTGEVGFWLFVEWAYICLLFFVGTIFPLFFWYAMYVFTPKKQVAEPSHI
jgi:hypothetical protein